MSYFEDNQESLIFGTNRRRGPQRPVEPITPYVPYDGRLAELSRKGIYMSRTGKREPIGMMSKERLQSLIATLESVTSNNGGVRKHYYLHLLRNALREKLGEEQP